MTTEPQTVPWPLSASSDGDLETLATQLVEQLRADTRLDPTPTLAVRALAAQPAERCRAVLVGSDRDQLLDGLDALSAGKDHDVLVRGVARPCAGVVLVFAGAGGQWRGMGGLWDESSTFRDTVITCADAFSPYLDWSLVDVVRGRRGAPSLNRVDVLQPALFTVMVALAEVWGSFGIRPAAVVGHSQGELAAAHVAGILSLADAARLVALRSRVIAAHLAGRGAMLSVPEPAGAVRARLAAWGDRLSVAAVNGPASTSVAGEPAAIEELFAQLIADGVRVARIASDFASHSAQVDTIREPLLEAAADIRPRPAEVLFSSAVTGGIVDHAALDAEYWFQNLRRPVAFDPAVRALLARGLTGFVEPSAHPLLTAPIEEIAGDAGAEVTAVGSLRMGESDARRMLTSVATAYVGGLPVDWRAATGSTPFWRAVGRGDLAGALGVVLPAQSQSQSRFAGR